MEWAKEYQLFLWNNVLVHAIPSTARVDDATTFRKRFVDKEAMQWWYRAITHSSYDVENNYSRFSELGNKLFQATILALDPSKSFAADYWVTKKTELVVRLSLEFHLRSVFPFTRDMLVDLLDSLYGCLYLLAENLYTAGTAYTMCRNLTLAWFKEDITKQVDYKDTLKQIFEALKWTKGRYYDPKELGRVREVARGIPSEGYELQQRLPEEAILWFRSRNVDLGSDLLGYGKASSISETVEMANRATLDILTRYGITSKFIEEENRIDMSLALPKMKNDSLVLLEINSSGNIYQLIGTRNDSTKVIVVSVLSKDHLITTDEILQLYIDFDIQPAGTIITL